MEYILELYKSKIKEIQLSDASSCTLYQFAISNSLSTYQVFNMLKNTQFKSEYKNVHKKVTHLHSLGLIQKIPKKFENLHNAIYYKITSLGIFYLIKDYLPFNWSTSLDILEYNGDDEFFKIFLYPYIDMETLVQLKHHLISNDIINYLKRCCNILIQFFGLLDMIKKDKGLFYVMEPWDNLHTYKKGMDEFEQFTNMLKEDYNLKWVDSDAKFNKQDMDTVTISKDKKILFLIANEKKTEVILKYENKILDKYVLRPLGDNLDELGLFKFETTTIEEEIKNIKKRYLEGYQIYEIVEDLALSIAKHSIETEDTHLFLVKQRLKDIKILARDIKFVKLLSIAESRYLNYFTSFKRFIVNE